MPSSNKGWVHGYNGQAIVERRNRLIVGGFVSQSANGVKEADRAIESLSRLHGVIGPARKGGADKVCYSASNVKKLEAAGIDQYISSEGIRTTSLPRACSRVPSPPHRAPAPRSWRRWGTS
jgi:hypothetical protein